MPSKRFAVVIPAHNAALTIHSALHSVAKADHCGWEIQVIVHDDGSADNTQNVAEQAMAELKLQGSVFRSPTPSGVGQARLAAIEIADADVIMHVDSDDLVRETRFRDALRVLQDPKVLLTAGNVRPFHLDLHQPIRPVVMPTCGEDIAAGLLFYCPVWGCAISFKTELLKRFDMPTESYAEDWFMIHRLVRDLGPQVVRNSGTILIDYRRHPGQATDRPDGLEEAIFPLWESILWDCLKLRPDSATFELHCRCGPYAFRDMPILSDNDWVRWQQWAKQLHSAAILANRVPHATLMQIRLVHARLSMRREEAAMGKGKLLASAEAAVG